MKNSLFYYKDLYLWRIHKSNTYLIMKKIIFLAFLAFTSASFQAQENKVKMDTKSSDFNKLTIEITTGQAKGITPFTEKYYIQHKFGTVITNSFNLGGRYMLNPIFGAKLDFGYFKLNNNPASLSKAFNLDAFTVGLQGVINTSNLFDISKEMGKFNMLIHGGFQVSKINSNLPELAKRDNNLGVMLGFSPQFKLLDKVSLIADITVLRNFRQFYTWDGNLADRSNNQDGLMVYTSLGLTYSIGKNKIHGDWAKLNNSTSDQIEDLQKRILKLETENKK